METVVLTAQDVSRVLEAIGLDAFMDALITRITRALAAYDPLEHITPARSGFQYQDATNVGLLEWMPILQAGRHVTLKLVGYHPNNPQRWGLPTILSTVSLFDVSTGHLLGLADATFLTAMRTGAASAVASRVLARPESSTLGLIGAGAQACTQLHALSRVFPLSRVYVYDSDPGTMQSFSRRVARLGLDLEILPVDLATLIRGSDLLCTATSVAVGQGPVFPDDGLLPWAHINAIGADFPGKVEVPLSVLKRAFVCPDFPEQALKEGECQQLHPSEVGASLVEVVKSPSTYWKERDRISVFDSTGWALEDQLALELLLEQARLLGIGQTLGLESSAADPKDPFGFLSAFPTSSRPQVGYR